MDILDGLMDEASLIRASQKGDKAAFGRLVDDYYKNIYRLAYSYTGYFEEADDICQETFLRAYDNIRKLKDSTGFRKWIFVITINLLHKRFKRLKRMRLDGNISTSKVAELTDEKTAGPLQTVASREKTRIIHNQLQEMPKHLRAVTILVLMEGLAQKDTAGILGCSESSVSRDLEMARNWLRARLGKLI